MINWNRCWLFKQINQLIYFNAALIDFRSIYIYIPMIYFPLYQLPSFFNFHPSLLGVDFEANLNLTKIMITTAKQIHAKVFFSSVVSSWILSCFLKIIIRLIYQINRRIIFEFLPFNGISIKQESLKIRLILNILEFLLIFFET